MSSICLFIGDVGIGVYYFVSDFVIPKLFDSSVVRLCKCVLVLFRIGFKCMMPSPCD